MFSLFFTSSRAHAPFSRPLEGRKTQAVATMTLGMALAIGAIGCRNDEEAPGDLPAPAGDQANAPTTPESNTESNSDSNPQGDPAPNAAAAPTAAEEKALTTLLDQRTTTRTLAGGALLNENGSIVIDETSLGATERVECLDTLVRRAFATPEQAKPWREAGVEAVFAADGSLRVLLSKPAAVAVSTFACDAPNVRLETQGHGLTLAGSNFKNTVVDTRKENGKAGNVVLVGSGDDAPQIFAQGAPGAAGKDAACPSGFEGCTNDTPPAFARPNVAPVSQTKTTAVDKVATEKAPNGKTFEFLLKPVAFPRSEPKIDGQCHGSYAKFISGPTIKHLGHVRITTHVTTPQWPAGANLDGRDGLALPAQDGGEGFAGGSLEALTLKNMTPNENAWKTQGGTGGAPGKGGLVAAAPGVAAANVTETTAVDVNAHTAKVEGTFEWLVSEVYPGGEDLSCRTPSSRTLTRLLSEVVPFQVKQVQVVKSTRAFTLPAGRGGFTPARPVARAGMPGADGKIQIATASSVQQALSKVPAEAVLPAKLALDLAGAWREGTLAFSPSLEDTATPAAE